MSILSYSSDVCAPSSAALAVQVRELKAQLKAGGGAMASPLLQLEGSDAPMSAREREELAMALMAGEGDKRTVDAQVQIPWAYGQCAHFRKSSNTAKTARKQPAAPCCRAVLCHAAQV